MHYLLRTFLIITLEIAVLLAITRLYLRWSYMEIGGFILTGIVFSVGIIWLYKRMYEADDDY